MAWVLVITVGAMAALFTYFMLQQRYAPRDGVAPAASGRGAGRRAGAARALGRAASGIESLLPMAKSDSDNLRGQLWQAGIQMAPGAYYSLSLGTSALLAMASATLALGADGLEPAARALLTVVLVLLSLLLPRLHLAHRIRRRRERIESDLPMVLEMLSSAMAAGLTLNLALGFVARKTEGPLADELRLVDKEVRIAGYELTEALRRMAERVGLTSVSVFASAVIQATAQGAGVARVLKGQAEQARERYYQKVEEQANKTPTKMLFPLLFLIMPCVFVIILTPMLMSVMDGLSML